MSEESKWRDCSLSLRFGNLEIGILVMRYPRGKKKLKEEALSFVERNNVL